MPRVLGGPRWVGVFLWARYPCGSCPLSAPPLKPEEVDEGEHFVLVEIDSQGYLAH